MTTVGCKKKEGRDAHPLLLFCVFMMLTARFLSRALRVKNETSISENLAHDTGPSLKIGVGGQLLKRVFISKHISLKVRLFSDFSDFPLNAVKI